MDDFEISGGMLFTGPVDRARNLLPSPNELKRKVLIKARKLKSAGGDGGGGGGGAGLFGDRHFRGPTTVEELSKQSDKAAMDLLSVSTQTALTLPFSHR